MSLHYHGTPVTPRERIHELAGRCFCVSYAEPRDVTVCHQIGQSVMLDNGAYTFWRTGKATDWDGYMDWAEPWLDYPTTWAVIPDVIDGSEDDNDRLLSRWAARQMPEASPVWHLHESLERLRRLAHDYERICFGSSGQYAGLGTPQWHRRISEAFDTLAGERGRVPWVHMLRGLAQLGRGYPFASADSANAARNHSGSWRQRAMPIGSLVARADAIQSPGRWARCGTQQQLVEEAIS